LSKSHVLQNKRDASPQRRPSEASDDSQQLDHPARLPAILPCGKLDSGPLNSPISLPIYFWRTAGKLQNTVVGEENLLPTGRFSWR